MESDERLLSSMTSPGSAAHGTVLRTHTVGEVGMQAGCPRCEVVSIENILFRFCRGRE